MSGRREGADVVVLGPNPRMRAIFEYIERVGPGRGTVLVTGESGTGKELVARAIHRRSRRAAKRPFVAVNCARVHRDASSRAELFGHERGAFTGADRRPAGPLRDGRAAARSSSTRSASIPLGDAGEAAARAAGARRCERRRRHTRDCRSTCASSPATNRDLRQMVADGRFREDLYYRLQRRRPSTLPPLRERREDMPLLIEHFLGRFFAARRAPIARRSAPRSWRRSWRYDWPGNVRELENTCERIAESCICGHVRLGCLGASLLFPPSIDAPSHVALIGCDERLATSPADVPVGVVTPPAVTATAMADDVDKASAAGVPLDEYLRRVEAR